MTGSSSAKRFALGLGSLAIGSLIYLLARPPWQAPLLTSALPLLRLPAPTYASFIDNLPSFLHTFAFILLFASVAKSSRRGYAKTCLLWMCVEVVFEVCQGSIVKAWIQSSGIYNPKGGEFSDALLAACFSGTFDVADLAAIILGGVVAFALLSISDTRGKT